MYKHWGRQWSKTRTLLHKDTTCRFVGPGAYQTKWKHVLTVESIDEHTSVTKPLHKVIVTMGNSSTAMIHTSKPEPRPSCSRRQHFDFIWFLYYLLQEKTDWYLHDCLGGFGHIAWLSLYNYVACTLLALLLRNVQLSNSHCSFG